jgi:hypothetical protein
VKVTCWARSESCTYHDFNNFVSCFDRDVAEIAYLRRVSCLFYRGVTVASMT